MIELTLSEIATAIGATLLPSSGADLVATGRLKVTGSVESDSRLVGRGSLFFAKPGEHTDGHNFVAAAAEAGAVAAVVERPVDAAIPQLLVKDSVAALGMLAGHVVAILKRGGLKIIGVTGSNGKTTTKNMLNAILSSVGETVAPIESYNNVVGAPISMLKAGHSTKFLVVELGAAGLGSIEYLSELARPDIGIVLKVGLAHVGEFGGIEVTAKIKGELPRSLAADAICLLNSDDRLVADMAAETKARVLTFGQSAAADYRVSNLETGIAGTRFEIRFPDGDVRPIRLKILGEHHASNALAAAAASDCLGISHDKIVSALEGMALAERWRMQLLERPDGVTIINDAYNASPESMKAALQTLATLGRQTGRRTVAVLGEMAELGPEAVASHDEIGRLVVRLNIDQIVVVGQGAKIIHMGASQEGSWDGESKFVPTIAEALSLLRGMLASGDIVLVKSSKSANLRHLGDELAEVKS